MSGAKGRTWYRVERDWFNDAKFVELVDKVGPIGIVGWFRLLGRACQSEGVFPHPLAAELRCADIGLDLKTSKAVAAALVEVGLVTETEDELRITAWDTYQPPMRFLHSANRGGSPLSATQPVAGRHVARDDERTNERTNKTYVRTGTRHGLTSVGDVLRGVKS